MVTMRLRNLQHPSKAEKLLEAYVADSGILPKDTLQICERAELPKELLMAEMPWHYRASAERPCCSSLAGRRDCNVRILDCRPEGEVAPLRGLSDPLTSLRLILDAYRLRSSMA
jgi:hypothetical protein